MKSLKTLKLERGAHPEGDGLCVMEAVAYFAHEPHSDSPACASPVISAFLRRWAGAAAGAAAWATAWAKLKPTVVALQKSALNLLDRMIEVGK